MNISVLIVVITRLVGVTKLGAGDEFVNDWNVAGDQIDWDAKFYPLSDNDETYAGLLLIHGHETLKWVKKKSFLIEDLREPIKLSLRYVEDKQKIKVRLAKPEILLFVHGLTNEKGNIASMI